jgi:hypothetical protein
MRRAGGVQVGSFHCIVLHCMRCPQLSAIAFSTSYQLVQHFRHADIIALGIGGVATGPLVLALQVVLDVGPEPRRWQWIAMFEVTAAVMVTGLLSCTSLFTQYWKVRGTHGLNVWQQHCVHAPTLERSVLHDVNPSPPPSHTHKHTAPDAGAYGRGGVRGCASAAAGPVIN